MLSYQSELKQQKSAELIQSLTSDFVEKLSEVVPLSCLDKSIKKVHQPQSDEEEQKQLTFS